MLIKTDLNADDKIAVNEKVLDTTVSLVEKVLDRVIYDNDDILYKPSGSQVVDFYQNISVIVSDRLKSKLLK